MPYIYRGKEILDEFILYEGDLAVFGCGGHVLLKY